MSAVEELHEAETQELLRPQAELDALPEKRFAEMPLFADVLLEADGTERRRRRWATFSSVLSQSLVLGLLLVIPLMFTDVLPKQQLLTFLVAPPPPPPPPPPAAPVVQAVRHVESDMLDGRLRTPSRIPQQVQMIREEAAPPPISDLGGVLGGVPGGIPGGQLGGVIGGIIRSTQSTAMVPKLAAPTTPKRVRVSQGVIKGLLLQKVEPRYPSIAMAARIQGVVVLSAVISRSGEIINLQAVSGHPLLVPAALEAVKQWRYRPFLLNGEPIEVESTIIVTFQLSQ